MVKKTTKVIELRPGLLKAAAKRQTRAQTLDRLGAILRRRTIIPLMGRSVLVEFSTEAEAREFQKLIHALPKRKP